MESKYYTPSVEEFYIGFEVEYRNPGKVIDWHEYEFGSWVKGKICNTNINCISPYLNFVNLWEQRLGCNFPKWEDLYRVKYLDKSDIESCGFEEEYLPNCNTDDDDITLGYTLKVDKNTDIMLHVFDGKVGIVKQHVYNEMSGNWTATHLFLGIIKNLSELKVLLKQLGVDA